MCADLAGMLLIAKQLGELKTAGALDPTQIALAKMNNCRKALEIARTCRELLGANGIHDEYHIGRRMVDLETVLTYEGTEHIHALTIGAAITGIKAFG
jgi:glutaryl-CoA dehydrogenase